MRWAWFALLVLAAPSASAFAFDPHGGSSASDAALHATRWDATTKSLVNDHASGLGGGIEFSLDAEFCRQLSKGFAQPPSCGDLVGVVYQALGAWEKLDGRIRFTDVSDQVPATVDGSDGEIAGAGAELDIFAVPGSWDTIHGTEAATDSLYHIGGQMHLSNGQTVSGSTFTHADLRLYVRTGCKDADPPGCWDLDKMRKILTHEVGHAIGLQHPFEDSRHMTVSGEPDCQQPAAGVHWTSSLADSIMNYDGTGHSATTPTSDDRAGVRVLYPLCGGSGDAPTAAISGATQDGIDSPTDTAAYREQGIAGGASLLVWGVAGGSTLLALVGAGVSTLLWMRSHRRRPAPRPLAPPGYPVGLRPAPLRAGPPLAGRTVGPPWQVPRPLPSPVRMPAQPIRPLARPVGGARAAPLPKVAPRPLPPPRLPPRPAASAAVRRPAPVANTAGSGLRAAPPPRSKPRVGVR